MQGKGSFQNSAGVKTFAMAMINRGHREFVVDLRDCPVMDSTFMGTLTGVALRLRELGHGGLHVVNSNARNVDLLQGLGLDLSLELNGEARPSNGNHDGNHPEEALAAEPLGKRQMTETMIGAHRALIEADERNLNKFKDVIDYLAQDLKQGDHVD